MSDLWFNDSPESVADGVFAVTASLDELQSYATGRQLRNLSAYLDQDISNWNLDNIEKDDERAPLVINYAKNLVDTATSKIATKKIKPTFLTDRGKSNQKKKAQQLNSFTGGLFRLLDYYALSVEIFRDCAMFGTGIFHVWAGEERPEIERVVPLEFLVDERECRYGKPRSVFRRKEVARDVLIAQYPEHEDIIKTAQLVERKKKGVFWQKSDVSDLVTVVEAHHLSPKEGEPLGRHVIAVSDGTLVDDDWEHEWFPYVFIHWSKNPIGFWGTSIIDEVIGLHDEANFCHRKVQDQMDYSTFQFIVQKDANVNPASLGGSPGGMIEVDSPNAITPFTPNTTSPETFKHITDMEELIYRISGISQLSAQGQKPAGINSGVALREYYDIESERFQTIIQQFENFVLECTERILDMMEYVEDLEVPTGNDELERLSWKKVYLAKDKYVIGLYPTNFLPSTPAGKFQAAQEMTEAGFLTKEMAMDLLDFPDIKSYSAMLNAPLRHIEYLIDQILEKGVQKFPGEFTNLELAAKIGIMKLQEAELDGVEEIRIEMLREFIRDVKRRMDELAPPPMGPEGPPMAPEGPLPPEGEMGPAPPSLGAMSALPNQQLPQV